jgi:tripartite-type tricarboxylate transporter receptor subunit TctC
VVAAAGFSEKPITYMICFDPGGESDITARLQQKYLEDVLKTKVVITYKVGGGGAVGWSELIRSKPDGYTIAGDMYARKSMNSAALFLSKMRCMNAPVRMSNAPNTLFFWLVPGVGRRSCLT